MKNQLLALQNELHNGLVGRLEIIKSALLALLAGENMVLVGPPGTGKSMVARRIAEALKPKGTHHYFEYLLTKFSTPEELFGPLSISALKQDCFQRNTDGYLPTVQVAFLDEIFKANSSILNALLTVLNERKFHNGTKVLSIPLQTLIAASNELPTGQEELAALYDRFLLRRFVGYLSPQEQEGLFRLPENTAINTEHLLSTEAIADIRQQAAQVDIPQHIQQAIMQIWEKHQQEFKENADEQLSDRRFVKALHLLRISSATNGRNAVDLSDILLLKDCLWNNAENADKVRDILFQVIRQFDQIVPADGQVSAPIKALPKPKTSKTNVCKGLKGGGTEQDPILIENIQDLYRLEQADVGQKGYYFRQTADIDGAGLSTWLNIQAFHGHYDGGGYSITYDDDGEFLFLKVLNSTIQNLHLFALCLAQNMANSALQNCQTSVWLIVGDVKNSTLFACQSGYSLISGDVHDNTTIRHCQTQSGLLLAGTATNSIIEDCQVIVNNGVKGSRGGIAQTLINSQVRRCWVEGKLTYKGENFFDFAGIAFFTKENSMIENCVVGQLEQTHTDSRVIHRITADKDDSSTLTNNRSLDSNKVQKNQSIASLNMGIRYTSDANGKDGADISAKILSESYLSNNLKWDFDTVWQWDTQNNRPQLRTQNSPKGLTALPSAEEGQESLLAQQMRNNIWL